VLGHSALDMVQHYARIAEVAQDATQGGLMRSTLPWFCRLWANARICRELGGVDDAGTTGTQGGVS